MTAWSALHLWLEFRPGTIALALSRLREMGGLLDQPDAIGLACEIGPVNTVFLLAPFTAPAPAGTTAKLKTDPMLGDALRRVQAERLPLDMPRWRVLHEQILASGLCLVCPADDRLAAAGAVQLSAAPPPLALGNLLVAVQSLDAAVELVLSGLPRTDSRLAPSLFRTIDPNH